MADTLSGTINERSSALNGADLYANVLDTFRVLPHPFMCIGHVAFKLAILAVYFIFPYILGHFTGCHPDFILTFVIIALLVMADYWLVKNCTASSLAGIAWYCDTSVSNEFIHKTVKDAMFLNKHEVKLFWTVVYIWPLPWGLNLIYKLSTIDIPWATLCALVLSAAMLNLMNCLKCSQEKRATASHLTDKVAGKFMNFVMTAKTRESLFPQ